VLFVLRFLYKIVPLTTFLTMIGALKAIKC
jgi:hypothetical protein